MASCGSSQPRTELQPIQKRRDDRGVFVCGVRCSVTVLRQAGNDRTVAVHALLLHAAIFKPLEQGAARFAVVLAVAKAARADQVVEFDEASFYVCTADMPQAEFADTR